MLYNRAPMSAPLSKDYHEVFGTLDDAAWLEAVVESRSKDLLTLPGFPSDQFQIATVGSAGRQAMQEAFGFWQLLRAYATRLRGPLGSGTRVLDFGCGWGRMVRLWFRDLRSDDIWGADVGRDVLEHCRRDFRTGHFEQVAPRPPSQLPGESFDLIYAYSVFSHLNEEVSSAWVEELASKLRTNGLLMVTTQRRAFVEDCARLRAGAAPTNAWEASLARLFIDTEACLAAYDRGEILHAATGGGEDRPASFYGETLIPPRYVERHWTRHLRFVDFVDDPSKVRQALIVMQK
jgi:2-polyprenyl-3-methyl-5-hydroxy-6-metoxy-1,4-benzoquinol methylase